ncbi:hypothetical protein BKA56DRAFT_660893 [Ilyonectria sp. MPI-CAGE-AT-0026]|nr:hypothetical protein BKA56DRAFT_660893 [Ilyonectria sp. MPI-CAGE-AT-0026]
MASAQPDAQINVYVGIDFGTTHSCLAYSLDFPIQSSNIVRYAPRFARGANSTPSIGVCPEKIPSHLWLHQDGSFASWGSHQLSSELSLVELAKLMLLHDVDAAEFLDSDWFVEAKRNVHRLGQNAVKVTTMYLQNLWNSFLQDLSSLCTEECKMHITFTVPADWPDDARTRMITAIDAAGIRNSTSTPVNFISEPEAVGIALLPRELHRINPKENDALIICDCGGGTIDCIGLQISRISPLETRECTLGKSILAGAAIFVNAFRERFIAKFRASCPGAQINESVMHEIERLIADNLKPIIEKYNGNDEKREISLPAWIIGSQARRSRAGSSQQVMAFTKEDMDLIFKPVERITALVRSQIEAAKTKTGQCPKAVIIAGGFGKNIFIQTAINQMVKDNFGGSVNVIQYHDNIGWLSVANGALAHAIEAGRKIRAPAMVASRISRHRYGFRRADQGLKWFLEKGASLSTDEANAFQVQPKDFQVLLSMGLHDGMSVTFTLYVDGILQGPEQVNFEYGY